MLHYIDEDETNISYYIQDDDCIQQENTTSLHSRTDMFLKTVIIIMQ